VSRLAKQSLTRIAMTAPIRANAYARQRRLSLRLLTLPANLEFESKLLINNNRYLLHELVRRCRMLVNIQQFKEGTPTACAHCGQPFRVIDRSVECWRSPTGQFFCNEFCADDFEEAAFQSRSRAR
jgi:hypothetical protein